jgi:hypothetical protein
MTLNLDAFGINAATLSKLDSYKIVDGGKTLLYDGDGACYEAAGNAAKETTAMNRFERAIYEVMFMAGCTKARVHLTPKGCFKNGRGLLKTVKPYQENRSGRKKPVHLDYLRGEASLEHFANNPDIQVFLHYDIEADDALMIDHFTIPDTILSSPDKDLNITPFQSYCVDKGKHLLLPDGDKFGYIERVHWLTPSGKPASKVSGKGSKFFLSQMLMGDTADNVKGIIKLHGKACGEAGAFEALNPIQDSDEAVNFVIDAYKRIDQNIIPEAEAMWLLRNRQDNAFKFFTEHNLTDSNLNFLSECFYEREWKIIGDQDE